jgi:hypothetical protein
VLRRVCAMGTWRGAVRVCVVFRLQKRTVTSRPRLGEHVAASQCRERCEGHRGGDLVQVPVGHSPDSVSRRWWPPCRPPARGGRREGACTTPETVSAASAETARGLSAFDVRDLYVPRRFRQIGRRLTTSGSDAARPMRTDQPSEDSSPSETAGGRLPLRGTALRVVQLRPRASVSSALQPQR